MSTQPHVLLVEDELHIAEVEVAYLQHLGCRVTHYTDGAKALADFEQLAPDLLVLDVMLPSLSGTDLCQAIRRRSQVPIIMVTAKVEEIDRLLGFEVGADDYLCKPFSPKELVVRVRALLRRAGLLEIPVVSHEPPLFEDEEDSQRIRLRGQRLDLTPYEYRLLRILLKHPSRVFSRLQLLQLAYADDTEVFDRAIDSHVKNLRKKIAGVMGDKTVIHSVYGVGYRFECD